MLRQTLSALLATVALGAGAPASATSTYEPIYITDGQFTATLEQRSYISQTGHLRDVLWRFLRPSSAAVDMPAEQQIGNQPRARAAGRGQPERPKIHWPRGPR